MQRKEFLKTTEVQDASKVKVGVVVSEYNPDITEGLLEGALKTLKEWKVPEENINIYRVYGSFDLTYACNKMINEHKPDTLIALGCIIKGETKHDEHIASAVTHSIADMTVKYNVPISLGIVTANNLEQAKVRSTGDTNHGDKAAVAALQAALL